MKPEEIFAKLHGDADAACGARLFTVTVLDQAAGVARRAYSSHPQEYPVTGTKPMQKNDWSEQVIERGLTFVANETAGFSPFFGDYELINTLGCQAVMNIPVANDECVVGTVNILDIEGHFTPARAEMLEGLIRTHRSDLLAAFAETNLEPQI